VSHMSRTAADLRELVRQRDGDNCYVCHEPIDFSKPPGILWGPSLEHVVPVAAGGSRSDLENLRLSHALPCNSGKGAVHDGVDYSASPVRNRVNPNAVPARQRAALWAFESWSAARN
jgi:hypothetical protein